MAKKTRSITRGSRKRIISDSEESNTSVEVNISNKKKDDNDDDYVLATTVKKVRKVKSKLSPEERFEKFMGEIENISQRIAYGTVTESSKVKKSRRNRNEHDNEEEDKTDDIEKSFSFSESPPFITGVLRDYQIRGLNWFISLRDNKVNGILADEMGLGKTLQTISILAYVKFFERNLKVVGDYLPSLIVVPLSTLHAWANEFKKWNNSMRVVILHGNLEEREKIVNNELIKNKFDVAITTYDMFSAFENYLIKFSWEYIIIDEAHRIKNEKTILAQGVRKIKSNHSILLTGTPLQNNLHELWALLNFLQPKLFNDAEEFDVWFDDNECLANKESIIQRVHKVIQPFMLRRIKKDVEKDLLPKKETTLFVGLTKLQKKLYKQILLKDVEFVINGKITRAKLLGIMQQLRKVTSHPYLFPGIEPGPPYVEGNHLVTSCGKMKVLDKLLDKLKGNGSRVLIFCQFVGTLDILEDYMLWKNFSYHRLDGSTGHADRQESIEEFQNPESTTFAFLISTRAGGLGITLTAADVVIFYDVDWNPQRDLQAADRAHRIGQTKQVKVFRIIAEGTVDERIYETAEKKLRLDNLIIQKGRMSEMKKEMDKNDIMEIIRKGVTGVVDGVDEETELDDDIEKIIENSTKKFLEVKAKLEVLPGCDDDNLVIDTVTNNSNNYSLYNFEGDDYKALQKLNSEKTKVEAVEGSRKRKQRFHIENSLAYDPNNDDKTYSVSKSKRLPFPPGYTHYKEYYLCDSKYRQLADRFVAFYRKCKGISLYQNGSTPSHDLKRKQGEIDNAVPLTEAEMIEMNNRKQIAYFDNWNQKDFFKIRGFLQNFGMNFKKIQTLMPSYTLEEIERYCIRFVNFQKENGNFSFLYKVREAQLKCYKETMFGKYLNSILSGANGNPLKTEIPLSAYPEEMFMSQSNYNLDKHIMFNILSKAKEQNISFENFTREKLLSVMSSKLVMDIKMENKECTYFDFSCDTILNRFMNLCKFIKLNKDQEWRRLYNAKLSHNGTIKQPNSNIASFGHPLIQRQHPMQTGNQTVLVGPSPAFPNTSVRLNGKRSLPFSTTDCAMNIKKCSSVQGVVSVVPEANNKLEKKNNPEVENKEPQMTN
uniref:ISWI chromatin-remodeling complex ATPase ISW1 n=1 Tax=Parastrongyloides trichosuri TaxID=131310 RepID=A0A0N4ZRN7_PARTI